MFTFIKMLMPRRKFLIAFIASSSMLILYIWVKNTHSNKVMENDKVMESDGKNRLQLPQKRFITFDISTSMTKCGGLGNMLFRMASLYGIATGLNRIIYLEPAECLVDYKKEFGQIFDNDTLSSIPIMYTPKGGSIMVDFGLHCCKYENPISLYRVESQYLKMHGNYLQSYKYFNAVKADIRRLFRFSARLINNVHTISKRYLRANSEANSDNSTEQHTRQQHVFCVHARRGEFMESEHFSSKQFTDKAIHYVFKLLSRKHSSINLILLGDDKNFLSFLDLDQTLIERKRIFNETDRNLEFGFAVTHCNSLLLTSGPSTYAWWIAYLMPADSIIFYRNCPKCTHIVKWDYYPNEWIPVEWDEMRKEVNIE